MGSFSASRISNRYRRTHCAAPSPPAGVSRVSSLPKLSRIPRTGLDVKRSSTPWKLEAYRVRLSLSAHSLLPLSLPPLYLLPPPHAPQLSLPDPLLSLPRHARPHRGLRGPARLCQRHTRLRDRPAPPRLWSQLGHHRSPAPGRKCHASARRRYVRFPGRPSDAQLAHMRS